MTVTRSAYAKHAAALALCASLALPATGWASNGGAAPGQNGDSSPAAGAPNAVTLSGGTAALVNQRMHLHGTTPRADAGRTIVVQRRSGASWQTVATATARRGGSFVASWSAARAGRYILRAAVATRGRSARTASSSPALSVTVYRGEVATWYGPGSWGSQTACGQTLTPRTLGVAHRSLPCGTRVAIRYHGRSITVPVIDRGPYANGANWDLTEATAKRLGFDGVATIGVLPLRRGG